MRNTEYIPWLAVEHSPGEYVVVRDSFTSPHGPRLWHYQPDGRIYSTTDLVAAWAEATRLNGLAYCLETIPTERTDENYIPTATGRKFWPFDPRPEDIFLEDIAIGLSNKCRYSGQLNQFYSVAQHCLLGHWYCEDPLAFLLHDAAEAYLADIPSPAQDTFPQYQELERRILSAVAERFGVVYPFVAAVHETDTRMRATEAVYILNDQQRPLMTTIDGVEPIQELGSQWFHKWDNVDANYLAALQHYTDRSISDGPSGFSAA